MNIKFIRNIFLSISVCLLLVSCEGKDCIEADDFGEYDTDLITIESKSPDCGLNSADIAKSSQIVNECIEREFEEIEFGSYYKIKSTQKDKKINCYELYSCFSGDSNCYDDYKVVNFKEQEVENYNENPQSLLQTAYNSCSMDCIKECLKNTDMNTAFETGWVPNNKRNEQAGNGIKLTLGQTVNIQAIGNIKLTESSEQGLKFIIGNQEEQDSLYKIFKNGEFFRDNLSPILSGGWCFGDSKDNASDCSDTTNPERRWIGEIDDSTENLQKRYEFLRRGVVILTRIPENGKIDKNNKYTGPELFSDESKWQCDYDTENQAVSCRTNYDSGDYKTENNLNFAMDNDFVKVNGGLVVPEQVSKLILSRPPILSGSDKENLSITENDIILDNTSSNAYKFKGSQNIKSLHPVKLAFSAPDSNIDNCQIIINNNEYVVNINSADKNNWFFASDTAGKPVIFNKNKYNTLKLDKSNDTMDWNSDNVFSIVVNAGNCKTDDETLIPIYVFVMPQNEILINKSGFVSFKTLLGNFEGQKIKFDIINPMYGYSSNGNDLNNNFYEYIDKPNLQTATLQNNDWSNEIYVRKGQILRFDSNSWFDITKQNNSESYTITRKTSKVDNNSENLIGIGDSLVLKIEYRPALLCSGIQQERIDNPDCIKKYNSNNSNNSNNNEISCSDTRYSKLCVAYKPENDKCGDNSSPNSDGMCYDRYCPMGCYCKDENCKTDEIGYIAGAADFKNGCAYIEGIMNATKSSCNKCTEALNNNTSIPSETPTKTIEVVQCYDLENYKGAVRNLFNGDKLSQTAENLGAKKLASIFEGGSYGNLDGMDVDNVYKDFTDATFSEFKYNPPFISNSLNSEINSANKYLSFLIINNKDFEFNSNFKSAGEYNLVFRPEKRVSKGEQLAVALVNGDSWLGYTDLSESHEGIEKSVFEEDVKKFRGWVVKYNTDKNNDNYGTINSESSNLFDNNGYITNLEITTDPKYDSTDNLRLFFKIIDKSEENDCDGNKTKVPYEEELCRCPNSTGDYQLCQTMDACVDGDNNFVEPERKTQKKCVNSYYNNDGSYTIKLRTPKDTTNATSYIVKYVMKPVLEILDGKNVGLRVDNNGNLVSCNASSKDCAIYFPESEFSEYENRFGESCKFTNNISTNAICYETCAGLDDSLYSKHCKYFNNGGGFLQRFYVAVITDNYYQTIVKLCFTLMIMFYGMYYLMGMAELTHAELIKRAFKISFIYLMIGTKGWEYYNMFFVKFFKQGVDYLVFAVASAFDDNNNLMSAFVKGNFYDKSVLFSGVDKNLSLLFSDAVSYKIWGLFFVSFFGWLYVFIIYSSILTYIFSVANAMLLYVTAQFFLSLLLAMGPIFFVMLIFDKTKEMFNKWISNLISFGLEQIFLLTCLSLFNILVYNIIKYVLSFRVCWKAVWEMNIPLLGSLQMMSFWKATTSASATAAATAVPGLFQILLIYLIADLMNKFIQLSTQLGGSIGGSGMYLDSLAEGIRGDVGGLYENHIKKHIKEKTQKIGTDFLKQTIGYKTAKEEDDETKDSKKARKAFRNANYKADKAVAKHLKQHEIDPLNMSEEQAEEIAKLRNNAFMNALKENDAIGLLKKFIGKDAKEEDILKLTDKDLQDSQSLLGWFGKHTNLRTASDPRNWRTHTGAFISPEEKAKQIRNSAKNSGEEEKDEKQSEGKK